MSGDLSEQEIRWLITSLKKVNFFSNITLDTIDKIVSRFIKKSFNKGETIIKEGKSGEAFYVIKSGSCLVYKKAPFFTKKNIATLKEGDFFGEMSLISNEKTSASVKTIEPTEIFFLLKSSFMRLLDENKELANEMSFVIEKRKFESQKS